MRPRHPRRRGTLTATAATLVALCAAQTLTAAPSATAAPAPDPAAVSAAHSRSATATAVTRAQDRAARAVARSLGDTAWRTRLRSAALKSAEVSVTDRASGLLRSQLAAADREIAAAKGLDAKTGPLLRLRLGDRSMRAALKAGTAPWVAAAVADDDAGTVTAYDSQGRAHRLDAHKAPTRPVYVVDVDSSKALAAGLDVLREELVKDGVPSSAPGTMNTPATPKATAATAGFWTTKITAVELSDDEEPWIKGDAEIYTLVTGFGLDGKVRVDPVDMPYLDNDGTVYRPNQILVNWSSYKYNLADAVMMEEDGSTNYRDLAKAIATALLTITDQGVYIPLVNAVLDAMPDDWWTDDPDYVDSWYTLAQSNNGTYYGARGNGWMTVEPYSVEQF
ncbi:DUF3103 family protein [Streptomyces brasiliensis]|uniref:DUF3103 family protein n=1 Tax=Streptomyces brasiliensis TaxID=1954 RepID=A0A917KYH3_9ACTN|nr:DUF3103 family protein [Streptomyces brasiliensis]GGJ35865.1 hypothetical protein GCM10010121_053860 [Streptomyces brasiliensis]